MKKCLENRLLMKRCYEINSDVSIGVVMIVLCQYPHLECNER
jgi:hypothetical protein